MRYGHRSRSAKSLLPAEAQSFVELRQPYTSLPSGVKSDARSSTARLVSRSPRAAAYARATAPPPEWP